MSKMRTKLRRDAIELPDRLRDIIRRDVDEGLARLRARDFDGEAKRRLERVGERGQTGPCRPVLLRRAPAFGLAAAALAIGAAVLWLGRGNPRTAAGASTEAGVLAATLQNAPGMMNLGEYALPESSGVAPGSAASLPLMGILSIREAEPSAREAPPAGPPPSRTTLEQKMRLLYADRIVERALAPFENKFKED